MATAEPLMFVPIGDNPAQLFGMSARQRACRLATNAGLECADAGQLGRASLLASMDYCWDPAWLWTLSGNPGSVLTLGGRPVMVHLPVDGDLAAACKALESGRSIPGFAPIAAETADFGNLGPGKRARPFVIPLDPDNPEPAERAVFASSEPRVTDALSLYVWRRPAFMLTRWVARAAIAPLIMSAVDLMLCLLTFWLFWSGAYGLGILAGSAFMVLYTLDVRLADCIGVPSKGAHFIAQGLDIVVPPFWWWAWLHGLATYGRPLEPVYATMVLWVILGGFLAQRTIELLSIRRFAGMEIHVWRPLDSKFRLVTAGRNMNMVILAGALIFGRPDTGLVLVAWWTLISVIFHAVRLAQMTERQSRGQAIVSWLDA